ncbi:hypothetical protein MIND_00037900 [Mycena indigotica]|uniref:GIT Spa2 homology (SHD) domain-containing protein n=1 Tax=Mycena indigotica TaxID=2126181 RepID=A0A8H6TGB8_9AGAR|nr:uncharacterized protein MIND_00037900 [Mycena indigotica]KAF7315235.1 hypothetical protein MIND_00037900 [Mycena indigotica]
MEDYIPIYRDATISYYHPVMQVYFNALDHYLAEYLKTARPNDRLMARQKLTRLSHPQVYELSTDVYDELMRREYKPDVPYLPPEHDFHPKRNLARQKLATLLVHRFQDLSSDVHFELARRYPDLPTRSAEGSESYIDTSDSDSVTLVG